MIDEIQFSERGDGPTQFEQRLLATIVDQSDVGAIGWRLVQQFGPEIGAAALATILDEIGGGLRYIPHRSEFFQRIWRSERNRLLVELDARGGWSRGELGRMFGISRARVSRIIATQAVAETREPVAEAGCNPCSYTRNSGPR